MMLLRRSLTILSLTLLSSALVGCGAFRKPEEKVVTVTKVVRPTIAIATKPKPIMLGDLQFHVVTQENFEQFKETFIKENGQLVFIALSIRDYEIMAVNIAELRRYINQQKEIIVYYEKSIEDHKKAETNPEQNK
jgi:hypothetical protein